MTKWVKTKNNKHRAAIGKGAVRSMPAMELVNEPLEQVARDVITNVGHYLGSTGMPLESVLRAIDLATSALREEWVNADDED